MKRRIPMLLALLFIVITIDRVASFTGSTVLSWLFAIGLTVSVFVSAYLLDYDKSKEAARVSLLFFVLVDGMLNLGEVVRWSVDLGRWDRSIGLFGLNIYLWRMADLVYGVFPTVAVLILGWLSNRASQIPIGRKGKGGITKRLTRFVMEYFNLSDEEEPPVVSKPVEAPAVEKGRHRQVNIRSVRPNEQRTKIREYMDKLSAEGRPVPSVRSIARELGMPFSTAQAGRRAWLDRDHRERSEKDEAMLHSKEV